MAIVVYAPDLMDRSRFVAVDRPITYVQSPDQLASVANGADMIIVDLGRPGALEAISTLSNVKRVGFVSHIDPATIAAAKAAGIEAMPRSRFFSRLVEICS